MKLRTSIASGLLVASMSLASSMAWAQPAQPTGADRNAAREFAMQGIAAKEGNPPFPQVDGQFTITTDGAILANNTDDGPQADTTGQRLTWAVNLRTPAAPTALIRMAP